MNNIHEPDDQLLSFIGTMNRYAIAGVPFLFIIDFDMLRPEIYKLHEIPAGIKVAMPAFSNILPDRSPVKTFSFKKTAVPYKRYYGAFKAVHEKIRLGRSYLLNLTFPTPLETDMSLEDIFYLSVAKYKLLYHNDFVVFSPEIFIRIGDGKIKSYPMKGTIKASIPDAVRVILNDRKEMAEHDTIVDLIRNDLSRISDEVEVTRYRYIDRIKTYQGDLLQVSSEITGSISHNYRSTLGELIVSMLPAGSVTGAPKKETLNIIREVEEYARGWYTGIFGIFDGSSLDSAVMIRFIENINGRLVYKSGGGITFMSNPEKEYEELISKVYVPVG